MTDTPRSGGRTREGPPHLSEDTCLDLLHNLLPKREREAALEHLSVCAECEERFRARFAEHERLRAAGELGRRVDGELEIEKTAPQVKEDTHHFRRSLRVFLGSFRGPRVQLAGGVVAIAAVVLLLVVSLQPDTPDHANLQWLPGHSEDLRFRAAVEAAGPDLAEGLEAYSKRDLDRAIESLGRAEVSGTLDMVRRIYLGSALAWDGQYEEAVRILRTVAAPAVPDPWGSEARWSLYVALRESGRAAGADSLLRVLSNEPGEVGERARRLLNQ